MSFLLFGCLPTDYQGKSETRISRRSDLSALTKSFPGRLSPLLRRDFEAASESSASSWVTTLLVAEHGFSMPKGEFHDALCLRFGWQLSNLLRPCMCGQLLSLEHLIFLTVPVAAFQLSVTMKCEV